jgi:glycosyltransferase involved in cell wall biosynthesis
MISIIIPTLNEEKLLDGMISQFSSLVRERHNLEIIVSDGGSKDRTLSIAHQNRTVVVENTDGVKQTISLGRNIGAHHARGDILVFLNADTRIHDLELFFQRIREEIEKPEVVAVTCSVEVYPEEAGTIDDFYHGFYNWLFSMMNRVGMGMGRGECHVMKRTTFETIKGYSASIAAGEDYDLFRRLESLGRIVFMQDVLVYESPRRYRKYGYVYVTASWFLNFLSVFFFRRSILSEWKPVR